MCLCARGSRVHFCHILLYEELRVLGSSYTRKCVFLDPFIRGSSGYSILIIWRLAHRPRSLRFALPLRSPRYSNVYKVHLHHSTNTAPSSLAPPVLCCCFLPFSSTYLSFSCALSTSRARSNGKSADSLASASHQATPVASLRIRAACGRKVRGLHNFPSLL